MNSKQPCKYAASKSKARHITPYGMIHAKARTRVSAGSNMECAGTLTTAAINIQQTNVAQSLHHSNNNNQVQRTESLLADALSKRPAMATKASPIKQPIQNGFAHTT